MSLVKVAQVLRERLGPEGADAVAEALDGWMADERRELLSRADEKVEARYESIHRRVHEDIAGVEIRLTKVMADFREETLRLLAANKEEFLRLLGAHKEENFKLLAAWKDGMLKWFLGAVFLNAGVAALTALAFHALTK